MKLVNARELRRQYQLEPARCVRQLTEALETKKLRPENFSVRDLFENLIENGPELLRAISYRRSGGMQLQKMQVLEAGGAVDTSAFSNITGQIVYNRIKDKYDDPEFLWPQLCDTIPTNFLQGERVPGVGRLGDAAQTVDEGQPYPLVGLNEEYIDTVRLLKKGFVVPCTREIIVADRTGILLKVAGEGGRFLGLWKEKNVLDIVTGVTNNYKRNGVSSNTYLASGSYVNIQTGNALDTSGNEWRALEKLELLFDAILDPNTGEPIAVTPDTLILPTALRRSAERILGATKIQTVDMRANAGTIRTESPNPYSGTTLKILSSPYVKARSSSATRYFFGRPQLAFAWMQGWDIETLQAANNSEVEFMQDIMMRFKVSLLGISQVIEPRFMCYGDA